MDQPPQAVARSHDPLAVALGNASLLSIGYVMLGRRTLAIVTGLVTLLLVVFLAAVVQTVWFEFVVVLWWVALIAHGWLLARRGTQRAVQRTQRLIALGVAVAVLAAVGFLRFDAAGIEQTVADARDHGDCGQAENALDEVWLGHRVADAPLTVRGKTTVEACQRLRAAEDNLTNAAVTGDSRTLKSGFDGLAGILADLPGHEKMVDKALDGFLAGLPAKNPCNIVVVTDWLRQRGATRNALDRSADIVPRIAPAALVGCGEAQMTAKNWEKAKAAYQQVVDQYNGHELAAKAQEGVRQASLPIELANVRSLLGSSSTTPAYCTKPAQYSGAAPYAKGNNRALFYGNEEFTKKLPIEWRTNEVTEAVLIVCMGSKDHGSVAQTCPYENRGGLRGFPTTNVAFHRIAVPVKAYELRTGKLVADTKVEINGTSCPKILSYTTSRTFDLGPPSQVYVTETDIDVHNAFRPIMAP